MKKFKIMISVFVLFLGASQETQAWNRNEHALIASTAAALVGENPGADFLNEHAFDVGYYANVPDLLWKRPATYKRELYQHFMDWEIFERGIPKNEFRDAFGLSAREFDVRYFRVKKMAGRSFWRIRQIDGLLKEVTVGLKRSDISRQERHRLQARWIFLAGVLAHYSGDLAQPLHVTENYDGQLSGQKGAHEFLEKNLAEALTPELSREVNRLARKRWKVFHRKHRNKKLDDLLFETALDSNKELIPFLERDRKIPRKNIEESVQKNRRMMIERVTAGVLLTAEIWSRRLGWKFDDEKFYEFIESPRWIPSEN